MGNARKILRKGGSFLSIVSKDAGLVPTAHAQDEQLPLRYAAFYAMHQNTSTQDELAQLLLENKLMVHIASESLFGQSGVEVALQRFSVGTHAGKHILRFPSHSK